MRAKNEGKTCSITDCVAPAFCKLMCRYHYRRFNLWGDPNYVIPPKQMPTHKVCNGCKIDKLASEFTPRTLKSGERSLLPQCKACVTDYVQRVRPEYSRLYLMKKRFGLTLEDWEAMREAQGNRCAICREVFPEESKKGGRYKICIDHCHVTNKVRGLLCHKCNIGLGHFNDDLERLQRAMEYIKEYA